jgi:hypothetical protein
LYVYDAQNPKWTYDVRLAKPYKLHEAETLARTIGGDVSLVPAPQKLQDRIW